MCVWIKPARYSNEESRERQAERGDTSKEGGKQSLGKIREKKKGGKERKKRHTIMKTETTPSWPLHAPHFWQKRRYDTLHVEYTCSRVGPLLLFPLLINAAEKGEGKEREDWGHKSQEKKYIYIYWEGVWRCPKRTADDLSRFHGGGKKRKKEIENKSGTATTHTCKQIHKSVVYGGEQRKKKKKKRGFPA